jgi:hypothetical protein
MTPASSELSRLRNAERLPIEPVGTRCLPGGARALTIALCAAFAPRKVTQMNLVVAVFYSKMRQR